MRADLGARRGDVASSRASGLNVEVGRRSYSLNCAARHLTAAGMPSVATISRNFDPNSVLVAESGPTTSSPYKSRCGNPRRRRRVDGPVDSVLQRQPPQALRDRRGRCCKLSASGTAVLASGEREHPVRLAAFAVGGSATGSDTLPPARPWRENSRGTEGPNPPSFSAVANLTFG
jgi:hypothetical protein